MATKIGKRIAKAVTNALRERDRAEMRAMDALLSLIETPHGKTSHGGASRRTTGTCRVRTRQPARHTRLSRRSR